MKLSFVEQRRSIAIAAGATFGGLMLVYLIGLASGRAAGFHEGMFPLVLLGSGTIVTSLAFIDLHLQHRSQAFLMLPVSALDRVIERILTTNVLFVIALALAYGLFSLIAAGIAELLVGRSFGFYLPLSGRGLMAIRRYTLIHAVFLFGAVYFRGKNLLKTLLSLAVLGMIVFAVTAVLVWLAFGDYRELMRRGMYSGMVFGDGVLTDQVVKITDFMHGIGRVVRFALVYVMTPFLWVLTWLRLRETEVMHGV
ncbi:MAG: hypothetical protein EA403_00485 [Spirochaetaceae bacterium]|nr:MAG: hypothetical protein EA403_00485 [Spirochaetaceae bacterium]